MFGWTIVFCIVGHLVSFVVETLVHLVVQVVEEGLRLNCAMAQNFQKILFVIVVIACCVLNQHLIMTHMIKMICYSLILDVLTRIGSNLRVNCVGMGLLCTNICLLLSICDKQVIYDAIDYILNQITIIRRLTNDTTLESCEIALVNGNTFELSKFDDKLSIAAIVQATPLIRMCIMVF